MQYVGRKSPHYFVGRNKKTGSQLKLRDEPSDLAHMSPDYILAQVKSNGAKPSSIELL